MVRKNVATQIHRTLDGLRDQFKRQSGHDISLDYLIYCPDYRLRDLNAVGLNASRIVDARDASRLADRIISILPPGSQPITASGFCDFSRIDFISFPTFMRMLRPANER